MVERGLESGEYVTLNGSVWCPNVNIPNSEGASPLRPRRSVLLRPAALTRTNTQFLGWQGELGIDMADSEECGGGLSVDERMAGAMVPWSLLDEKMHGESGAG